MFLNISGVFLNLFLGFLLFHFPLALKGQGGRASVADSIRMHHWKDSSWYYAQRDLDRAQMFSDSLRSLAEKYNDSLFLIVGQYTQGGIEKAAGNNSVAKDHFLSFLAYWEGKENNTQQLSNVYFQLTVVSMNMGNFSESLDYCLKSLDLYKMQKDSASIATTLNSIGMLNRRLKDMKGAYQYYFEALDIHKSLNNKNGQAIVSVNLANLYALEDSFDQAEAYYQKAIELDSELGDKYGLAYDYENLGSMYGRQKRLNKALEYHQKALAMRKEMGNQREVAISQVEVGNTLVLLGRTSQAIPFFQEALQSAMARNSREEIRQAQKGLSMAYEAQGNYAQALKYHKDFFKTQDSILNKNISRQMAELRTQYETAENEKEIAELNLENDRKAQALAEGKRQRQGLLLGLGLLLAAGGIGLWFYRKLSQKNALIGQTLEERETLLKEIHHRVKNNLQVISSLLRLQSRHMEDEAAIQALDEGRNRVKSMALIHQNLYQDDNLMGISAQEYIEKLCNSLFNSYKVSPQSIHLQTDIDDLNLDVDTVIPLGLVLNELLTNALKYAFPNNEKGNISVSLKEDKNVLLLKVADDGVGLPSSADDSSSFGHRLIHTFAKKLKADVDIQGEQGTQVLLKIHAYKVA